MPLDGPMVLEVEVKARIPSIDTARSQLEELGAERSGTVRQEDTYYTHPCRDLAARDEAVRVRRVDDRVALTWKGPKLDDRSKTRTEASVLLEQAADLEVLMAGLGFQPAHTVSKTRTVYQYGRWTVCLDEVDGLEPFVEVEIELRDDEAGQHDDAVDEALAIVDRLGGGEPERRSYLELVLEADTGP